MKILLLAALLATPAIAQSAQPQYSLDYQEGYEVDLNQGWYVCKIDNPRDLMMTLMEIKDDKARRARAASGGCPFHLSNAQGPRYKVTNISGDACMERTKQQGVELCGVEGHQMVVEGQGKQLVVFQLSLDISFD